MASVQSCKTMSERFLMLETGNRSELIGGRLREQ